MKTTCKFLRVPSHKEKKRHTHAHQHTDTDRHTQTDRHTHTHTQGCSQPNLSGGK